MSGTTRVACIVHRCWASEFQALPDLDADTGTVAFQRITLENEGWERDRASGTSRAYLQGLILVRHSAPQKSIGPE